MSESRNKNTTNYKNAAFRHRNKGRKQTIYRNAKHTASRRTILNLTKERKNEQKKINNNKNKELHEVKGRYVLVCGEDSGVVS